jgi:hypothetical protein
MERQTLNLSLYFMKVEQPAVKLLVHAGLALTLHAEGCSAASFKSRPEQSFRHSVEYNIVPVV